MSQIDLYVPVYRVGANGKLAYQLAKVSGVTVTNATVPEGELMIKSAAVGKTPPVSLQPPPTS